MAEALAALAVFALLAAGVVAHAVLSALQLLLGGAGLIGLGVVASVVGGTFYHLALHAALAPRQLLPPRWYWQPVALHPLLSVEQRGGVLAWFTLGATGFGLVLIGCAGVLVGTLSQGIP